jgi:phospholipase C
VFQVYDRLQLGDIPRRYTVEPGKHLTDVWTPAANGNYDVWVLGPNGFHRHATGNVQQVGAPAQPNPEVHASVDRLTGNLRLNLVNTGQVACTFALLANQYFAATVTDYVVAPRSNHVVTLGLGPSKRWYDFSVRVKGLAGFTRRFAGRVENGLPSVSDPAMHGVAQVEQWPV